MKDPRRTWRQGVVVGLIAYASVAIFYGIFDFLAARMPLYTVNLLGQSVFRGLRDPAVLQYAIQRDPGAIFLYNGLHLLVSLAIGLFVVRLIAMAEDDPRRAGPVLLVIVAGFVLTVLAVGLLTSGMRPLLPGWSIVVANGLATVMAGLYLLRTRPGLPWSLLARGGSPARNRL